jgi:hypothetical protein
MLEGLSDVGWAQLEHAYGSAADVPDLIRALRAADPKVRANARWELYGNIFHQGSRYEASAYAVPFLLELLADPSTPERTAILALLTSLAIGYDENWLPDSFPVADLRPSAAGGDQFLQAGRKPAAQPGDIVCYEYWMSLDAPDRDSVFSYIALAVYDAVRVGVPLYCDLLRDDDADMRAAAAYALAWFHEDAAAIVGPLTAAAGDSQAAVAATALVALGLVRTDDPAAMQAIQAALADPRDLVRWGAAVALARLLGPAADAVVADELLAWAGGDSESRDEIPFLYGDVGGYAGLALRQLDVDAQAAFDALLARIPAVSGPEAMPVVGEALRHAFPAGPVTAGAGFTDLDQRQQRLLGALAASPSTWGWGESLRFGNFMAMLSGYGLPDSPEAMGSFVSGS